MLTLDHHGYDQRLSGEDYFCELGNRQPRGAWLIQELRSGSMIYRDQAGKRQLQAGDVILARFGSHVAYGFNSEHRGPAEIRWAVIRGQECDALMQPLCIDGFIFKPQKKLISTWLDNLIAGASRERIADTYAAAESIYASANRLPQVIAQDNKNVSASSATEDAMRLLVNNPLHPWSIDELAQQCGCNRDHLSRVAKKHFGMNPLSWLHQERLQAAENLLRNTSMSVANIAEQCGFGNAQALARHIRKKHGRGPREFRAGRGLGFAPTDKCGAHSSKEMLN